MSWYHQLALSFQLRVKKNSLKLKMETLRSNTIVLLLNTPWDSITAAILKQLEHPICGSTSTIVGNSY